MLPTMEEAEKELKLAERHYYVRNHGNHRLRVSNIKVNL